MPWQVRHQDAIPVLGQLRDNPAPCVVMVCETMQKDDGPSVAAIGPMKEGSIDGREPGFT